MLRSVDVSRLDLTYQPGYGGIFGGLHLSRVVGGHQPIADATVASHAEHVTMRRELSNIPKGIKARLSRGFDSTSFLRTCIFEGGTRVN
jgi:hypothetical protein